MSKYPDWEPWEDVILRSLWGKVPTEDMPLCRRSARGIRARAATLGIDSGRFWKPSEVEYLKRAYGILSVPSIALRLNKPKEIVYAKACYLGITTPGGAINVRGTYISDDIIRRYLQGETATALAAEIGISWYVFAHALKRRGITRRTVGDECRKRLPRMYEINKRLRADPEWRKALSAKMQGVDLKDWKKFSHPGRISSTLAWRKWRILVYKRDGFKCAMCRKSRYHLKLLRSHLEPHHIRPRRTHPEQTFEVTNGITLCHRCHRSISNNEHKYEAFFDAHVQNLMEQKGFEVYE